MQDINVSDLKDTVPPILIAEMGGAYWLLEGEHHLNALLAGRGGYPTPVRCLRLGSTSEFIALLPDGVSPSQLWGIHPAVAARLHRRNEVVSVALSASD